MPDVPSLSLNNGVQMPQLGFGVFQVPPDEAEKVVSLALEAGYRSIDTAAVYENEEGVGRAIAASGLARDELFITTKLWNSDQGKDAAKGFEVSLDKLGLEQLDLYLVHWPVPAKNAWIDTWHALQEVYAAGRTRALGVSNFTPTHLRRLFVATEIVPAVNQIELHPWFPQAELRAFHAEHGIATEAWSPLGQGGELLESAALGAVAAKHGVSPAQVVLRWHLQLGNVVIPKSVTPERIASNLDVFGFELDQGDLAQVSGLDVGKRLGPDPDTFNAGA